MARQKLRQRILDIYPKIPKFDREAIIDLADKKNKKKLASNIAHMDRAIQLSLIAHIRHTYTDYDALLLEGYDPLSARHFCIKAINAQLRDWKIDYQIEPEERPKP